jgi:hypothetical protein
MFWLSYTEKRAKDLRNTLLSFSIFIYMFFLI